MVDGRVLRGLAARVDAEPGALEAEEGVVEEHAGGRVAILAIDRHAVDLARLHHPRVRPRDELARCRGAALVVVDDRVAVRLVLVAAADDQPALDRRGVGARVGLERERRRVDRHVGRLDQLRARLEVADAVAQREVADRDLDLRVEEPVPVVVAEAGAEPAHHRGRDVDERVEPPVGGLDRAREALDERGAGVLHRVARAEVAAAGEPVEQVDGEREAVQGVVVVLVDELGRQRHRERRRRVRERRRVEHERRRCAADLDRVVARAALDVRLEARARAEDVDVVVPAGAVDLDRLDAGEGEDPAGARDVVVGDDEDVADRRADDDDRVDARAAVDEHRRVLEVVVAVRARAAEQAARGS